MDFSWISWLGNLVKLIGDLIPVRVLIEPTHKGVKYKGMKKIIVLDPGIHWYIPFFTVVHTICVVKQTLDFSIQDVITKDDKPIKVKGSITYTISDVEKALVECECLENEIDDESMAVICDYLTSVNLDDLGNRKKIASNLTKMIGSRLNEYGVNVMRAQLTSVSTGIPILHIGQINV